ncbi:MAG: hypothetical protein IJ228_04690 [Succinivibrio sp.]|nr:hypothetical protein [Succinivibrio sp.]
MKTLFKPLIFLTLGLVWWLHSAVCAQPGGFEAPPPPTLPNTVAGVRKTALEDDFVMLRGRFEPAGSATELSFSDTSSPERITVRFDSIPAALVAGAEYYLWSQVEKTNGNKSLHAIFISPVRR